MTDCPNAEMRDLLPELVAGRLGGAELDAVTRHLQSCLDCAAEVQLLSQARSILRAGTPVPAPSSVDRIVAALPDPSAARRHRWSSWRVAAAVALFAVGGGSYAVVARDAADRSRDDRMATVAPAGSTGLAMAGRIGELGEDQLAEVITQVDQIEALPAVDVDPGSLGGVIPDSLIIDLGAI